jgi:hypothetical protein
MIDEIEKGNEEIENCQEYIDVWVLWETGFEIDENIILIQPDEF